MMAGRIGDGNWCIDDGDWCVGAVESGAGVFRPGFLCVGGPAIRAKRVHRPCVGSGRLIHVAGWILSATCRVCDPSESPSIV